MHIIAQCLAIGLGFACGLVTIVFCLTAIGSGKEEKRHKELLAQYAITEARLAESTASMRIVANAALKWTQMQEKPPIIPSTKAKVIRKSTKVT
jgi:hypothetical protein